MMEKAIKLAKEMGLYVFPTVPNGKAPACRGGHKSASSDPAEVERLFREAPEGAGIGVNLMESGLVAIDYDAYKEDPDDAAWIAECGEKGLFDDAVIHSTPKGGIHYIFDDAYIPRFPGQAGLTIDIKHNGYVLWPPTAGYSRVRGPNGKRCFEEIPKELEKAITAASGRVRKRLGATGTSTMFATADEAIEALRNDIPGQRHDAMMRVAIDVYGDHIGEPVERIVDAAIARVRQALGKKDTARLKELLDPREGGELWRLVEGAGKFVGRSASDDLVAAARSVLEREGTCGSESYAVWEAAEVHIQREAREAAAVILQDADDDAEVIGPTEEMEPTQWIYGAHMVRRRVSVTVAPGGVGKSMLAMTEALAVASGRPLLGQKIWGAHSVLVWNGEDSEEDLRKRFRCACKAFELTQDNLIGKIYLKGADTWPVKLVIATKGGEVTIVEEAVKALKAYITKRKISLVIFDPLVAMHMVSENDNGQMEVVFSVLRDIAKECNCAVEVVHHSTKEGAKHVNEGGERAAEATDARGAGAIVAAARSVRHLANMGAQFAKERGIEREDRMHLVSVTSGKSNLTVMSDAAFWFKRQSIAMNNGRGAYVEGDYVGVAMPYSPPQAAQRDPSDLLAAVLAIAEAPLSQRRVSAQSPGWAGYTVARALKLDVGEGVAQSAKSEAEITNFTAVKKMLAELNMAGGIERDEVLDDARRSREVWVATGDDEFYAELRSEIAALKQEAGR